MSEAAVGRRPTSGPTAAGAVARAEWIGFLLFSPGLALRRTRAELTGISADALSRLPQGFTKALPGGVVPEDRRTVQVELDGALVRMLQSPDRHIVRGLPPAIVLGDLTRVRGALRGAFLAAPVRVGSREWKVSCPSAERSLALAGLLRRVGIVSRPATTEKSPTVKVPFAEHSALTEIGVKLTSPPGSVRVKVATGQETLDVINARRRAEQEERTRKALVLLGDTCPPALRQAGELRLLHPELSLEALGELMDPPATRHTVCGQLRRLHQMAMRHPTS